MLRKVLSIGVLCWSSQSVADEVHPAANRYDQFFEEMNAKISADPENCIPKIETALPLKQ